MQKLILTTVFLLVVLAGCGAEATPYAIYQDADTTKTEIIHNIMPEECIFLGIEKSQIIVLASDVDVSRTAIAFNIFNRADEWYTYGRGWRLAKYDGGIWATAPTVPIELAPPVTSDAITIFGGEYKAQTANFHHWFEELLPGKYMYFRTFFSNCLRYEETLMVEFFVDNDTPLYLPLESRVEEREIWSTAPFEHLVVYAFEIK